jgi:type IV secretory pathway VirB10-like protein
VSGSLGGRGAPSSQRKRGGFGRFWSKYGTITSIFGLGSVVAVSWHFNGRPTPPPLPMPTEVNLSNFNPRQLPPQQQEVQPVIAHVDAPRATLTTPATTQAPPADPPAEDPAPMPGDRAVGGRTGSAGPATLSTITYKVRRNPPSSRASAPGAAGGGSDGAEQERAQGTRIGYKDETMVGSRAGAAIDTSRMMWPGHYQLILRSSISSERDGPFFAHFADDVLSDTNVTLIPKNTRVWGTYESQVGEGQERIVTAVAEGITHEGIPFKLGSPVGDEQGRIGMPGHVDRKTWPKLRNALILMTTQGALSAANSALQAWISKGGSVTNFNMGSGGMGPAMAGALGAGGNIQAVITKHAGEKITVALTHPIQFDRSYRLEPR